LEGISNQKLSWLLLLKIKKQKRRKIGKKIYLEYVITEKCTELGFGFCASHALVKKRVNVGHAFGVPRKSYTKDTPLRVEKEKE
jgi:hypothetical protein